MRGRWLFLIAVIGVFACAVVAVRVAMPAPRPAFRTVGTLKEVMESTVSPAAYVIFDSVVYSNGVLDQAPKTDEDWEKVEHGAIALAESANLLLLPGRAIGEDQWVVMTHALADAAVRAQKAALTKNVDELLAAGDAVYTTCTNCHATYLARAQQQRQSR